MAASSSSSPSTPTFPSSWKYHVFLSFRGEDTRKNFVGHLYKSLVQQGINTYKDDKTLARGESIGPSLMKAIEDSRIAIIIFSENYANSSWCLNELAYIIKCKETRWLKVMPIFYDVDPSEVRKQTGKYGEALAKHESDGKMEVESWRKALEDASNLSGWEPKCMDSGDESEAIQKIVDTISQTLNPLTSSANGYLIGIDARVQDLKSKLQIESDDVLMIGIWGGWGWWQFDGSCFLENIQQESVNYGLQKLQENLVSKVLKQKQVQFSRVEDGRRMIKDRFCDRKVLIVLDDVHNHDQLNALAGSRDWFGKGSRIIITTRDEHLLNAHKVGVKHNIILLTDKEAIMLFQKHSPQGDRPIDEYELLSKKVVSYARGLPLALEVLGRLLCNRSVIACESALDKLKDIPDANIIKVLKISYDELEQVQKNLFLDIACFFRRADKDRAMETLDACGFYPDIGVEVLIQRALITISEDGRFDMHDLLQEMAHHIVRGEHPENPEKHSRVWKREDVLRICTMDATTEPDMIEAIRFKCNRSDRLQCLHLNVANMKKLRWLDWEGDLANPLPNWELRCLKLNGISQNKLWEGCKHLPNLRMMELYGLRNLIMTPDFRGLPNLERFKLTRCSRLEEIHPSIGCLKKLAFLSIEVCYGLKMFPPITRLRHLKTLTFSRCPKLFNLSKIQQQNMNHIGLQFSYTSLKKLDLSYCDLGDEDISSVVWVLPNLRKLDLTGNKFSQLNFSRLRLPRLKWLNISHCERLLELSELPSSIAVLIADNCTSLDTFGDVSNCKWLWNVSHRRGNKRGGDMLLYSMLQGNAIEDHYISATLEHHNPEAFVSRLYRGRTFTLHLPNDWYDNYFGFLVCFVTDMKSPRIDIIIEQKVDKYSQVDLWQESDYEELEPEYDKTTMSMGYVSFNKLRQTALLTSSYKIISFSIEDRFWGLNAAESYVGVDLVPRNSKGGQLQTTKVTTNCSEFSDEGREYDNTFTIQHDSKSSSIKIQWFPYDNKS